MIYSGLDFAQYLEIDRSCRDTLAMVVPASQMIFTFLQMYFIFLNAKVLITSLSPILSFVEYVFLFRWWSSSCESRRWLISVWCTWWPPTCVCGSTPSSRKPNTKSIWLNNSATSSRTEIPSIMMVLFSSPFSSIGLNHFSLYFVWFSLGIDIFRCFYFFYHGFMEFINII